MPPKGRARRKRDPNFAVINVVAAISVGALSNDAIASAALTGVVDDHYEISADLQWSIRDHTAGEGPIQVGVTSGDLTQAEVLEALAASPTGRSDRIAKERSSRPVRRVGFFAGLNTEEVLNDGKSIRTRTKWPADDTDALSAWAVNRSGATLTTGTILTVVGNVYIRWT